MAVVDAPTAAWCSRIATSARRGRAADPGLQWDLFLVVAGRGIDDVAGAAAADRDDRQRNLSARVARRHQGRVRVGARFRRRSRFVVDAGAAGRGRQADAARRASGQAGDVVNPRRRHGRPAAACHAHRARARQRSVSVVGARQHALAFYAVREGIGSVWVATVEPPRPEGAEEPQPRPKPAAQPQLVSRKGGAPAWSPDGKTLLVSGLPDPQPVYNGNPLRNEAEAPPLFALNARVPAVARRRAAAGARRRRGRGHRDCAVAGAVRRDVRSRVGDVAHALLLDAARRADRGPRARDQFRPRATAAKTEADLETVDRRDGRGAAADQAGGHVDRARSSSRAIRWRPKPAASRSRRAATSSTR